MTTVQAVSTTPYVRDYLRGHPRRGFALGHGYIRFPDYVIAVTRPGEARMPNGIETDVPVAGEDIWAGEGHLRVGETHIQPCQLWSPRPTLRFTLSLQPMWKPETIRLIGWGPGLTPLGDDIICGYVAGLALTGRGRPSSKGDPGATTSLSRALLDHAGRGELPSPTHTLLSDGDATELLRFGASSGTGLLLGLAAAMRQHSCTASNFVSVRLALPGDGPAAFKIGIHPIGGGHGADENEREAELAQA